MTSFDRRLALGQIGENTVVSCLEQEQFNVERNCDGLVIDHRGPSMLTPQGKIPRPDLTISQCGVSIPAEVKTKTNRTKGIITGEVETGIDATKWQDYQEYSRKTGLPVLLVFCEYLYPGALDKLTSMPEVQAEWAKQQRTTVTAKPDSIFAQWLHHLTPSLSHPKYCHGRPMFYFSIWQFEEDWLALVRLHVRQNATRLF